MTLAKPETCQAHIRAVDQVRYLAMRLNAVARARSRLLPAAGLGLMLAASVHGASVQLGASAETAAYLPSRQNSCFGSSSGLFGAAVSPRSCEQNVTPSAPGLAPEYTATLSAGAIADRNQLPALRGFAEVTRFPRMGAVSAYEINAEAKSGSRSFLAWNRSVPMNRVQFEVAISGQTLINSPAGMLYNSAGYTLDAVMQRGSVNASNVFTPYSRSDETGLGKAFLTVNNAVYGHNGVGHYTFAGAGGSFTGLSYIPSVYAVGTGIEIWSGIASDPSMAPTWRSLTLTTSPHYADPDVSAWLQENPSNAQRFRISLGIDFVTLQFGSTSVPAGSVEGVLFDFSATTFARLTQQATVSHSDDIVFHNGQVQAEFSNTFQVSELSFYDNDVDVTIQAGGGFSASFAEASALAAPVPEPEVVAMWLAGLSLLALCRRRAGPSR